MIGVTIAFVRMTVRATTSIAAATTTAIIMTILIVLVVCALLYLVVIASWSSVVRFSRMPVTFVRLGSYSFRYIEYASTLPS